MPRSNNFERVTLKKKHIASRLKLDEYARLDGKGQDGIVSVYNEDGKETIRLDGKYGSIYLGDNGEGGDVFVRNKDGNKTIHLDGNTGKVIAKGIAVKTTTKKDTAIWAISEEGRGLDARSKTHNAVEATSEQGIGVYGKGGTYAGYFEGIVMVTGDVQLQNADCAEDFETLGAELVEAGTVMTLNDAGQLEPVTQPYDKRVAGVVSGAGNLKPGLVLGKQPGHTDRLPIALMGKVNCKVDAQYTPIEVGDLLTTSPTTGHAMKADNPLKAFGAVIGKALAAKESGCGLIPILVALQ